LERPVDKPIGDKQTKKGIRVSGHPKSPSMSKNNKATKQKDEEHAWPEEPSSPRKNKTQSLLLKIERLQKENEKLRKQLAEDKVEARAPGLDTLVQVVERVRKGNVPGVVCTTCAKELVAMGYRVCAVDTISKETQTES